MISQIKLVENLNLHILGLESGVESAWVCTQTCLRCLAPAIQEVPQQFASSNNADGNTAENQPRSQCGNIARAWCGRCTPHRSESPFAIQFNSSSQDSVHDKRTKLDPSINLSQLSLCLPLSSITTAFIFPSLCYVKHRINTHRIDLRQSTQQSRIFTFKPNKLLELRSQEIVASSNAIEIALTKAQVIHRITEERKSQEFLRQAHGKQETGGGTTRKWLTRWSVTALRPASFSSGIYVTGLNYLQSLGRLWWRLGDPRWKV